VQLPTFRCSSAPSCRTAPAHYSVDVSYWSSGSTYAEPFLADLRTDPDQDMQSLQVVGMALQMTMVIAIQHGLGEDCWLNYRTDAAPCLRVARERMAVASSLLDVKLVECH
jgi:hypothetical protein